ncbi:hypothetical protein [Phenylobacterium sp. SCN 70-31]|uniref:hypothetical protein n=1 Tax=Phenylobacterium sp. SCN 70-31 TaxID=1660129 RepID=UPI00086C15F5|nr:hypothetical protein [Phenylobacterium sp. SCN 70-31]ODT87033.1 MAG: hypothetical protein ABS78_13370 [Phenylobacterium sp. SCN 70-31]
MTDLTSLIERIEAGDGADRALECDVARAFGWHRVEPRFTRSRRGGWIAPEDFMGVDRDGRPILSESGTPMWPDPPRVTTDLNAVIALCERVLPGWQVVLSTGDADRVRDEERLPSATLIPHLLNDAGWALGSKARSPSYAKTPARALLAALLRAKEGQSHDPR